MSARKPVRKEIGGEVYIFIHHEDDDVCAGCAGTAHHSNLCMLLGGHCVKHPGVWKRVTEDN